MEDLITYAHVLYDQPGPPHSPPLPPTPAGEPVPVVTYGSKTTKVTTLPPDGFASSQSQDFTPTLPSRPNDSLHPSSRAFTSPSKFKAHPEKSLPVIASEQPQVENTHSFSPVSEGRNSVMFPQSVALEEQNQNRGTLPGE